MTEGPANPLVAARKDSTTAYAGVGLVEGIVDCANGFSSGSWIDASIGGLSTGLEALGLITDPLGTLVSWGVAWLMEHVKPLSDALDWLAGDPDQITAYAQTWRNVAERANGQAKALADAVGKDIAHWSGTAGTAYRTYVGELHQSLLASAKGASTIAMIVEGAGLLVALVRELVRDLIADFVSTLAVRLWEWLAEEACTLGLGTPWVIGQVSSLVAKWAAKIGRLLNGLTSSVRKLKPILSKLDELIDALKATLRKLRGAPHTPGVHSPDAPNIHDVSYHPKGGPDTPSPHGSPDGPSLAGSHSPDGPGAHVPDGTGAPHASDGPNGPHKDGSGDPALASSNGRSDSGKRPGDNASGGPEKIRDHSDGTTDTTPGKQKKCASDPVDVVTGAVVLAQTDLRLAGLLPMVLERTHVSSYRVGRWFGRSWASTLDQRLEVDAAGVCLAAEDGMLLHYPTPPADGTAVVAVNGPQWQLRAAPDGLGYQVTDARRGWTWHFRALPGAGVAGTGSPSTLPLVAITERRGHRIDIAYSPAGVPSEISHSGGYRVAVDSAGGRITGLRLFDAARGDWEVLVRFGFDAAGNLTDVIDPSGATQRFTYDAEGRMTGWLDRNGSRYRYRYDACGRCIQTVGPGGSLSSWLRYDLPAAEGGSATAVVDSLGNTTVFHANARGRIVREVDPLGNTTTRQWDERDQMVGETDPLGNTTTYIFDDAGNITAARRPDGRWLLAAYDASHRPLTSTDTDGATWHRRYDAVGNLAELTDPTGAVTRFAYDERGCVTTVVDQSGESAVTCDDAGLVTSVTRPDGETTRFGRDHAGRVTTVTDPLGGVTRTCYDPAGNPVRRVTPDGGVATWRYDAEGNLVEHVGPTGAVTRMEYTHFDLPSARVDPDGTRFEFAYDTELRLATVTNPQGAEWAYTYDAAGNLVAERDFAGRVLRYRFDAAGRMAATVNAAGQEIAYLRDALGRTVVKRTADGDTRFAYDAAGRLVRATSPTCDLQIGFDQLGRIVAETVDGKTTQFAYDGLGRRVRRVTPTGATSVWDYDAGDRATALHAADRVVTFGFDAGGRLIEQALAAGGAWQAQRYGYDTAGRVVDQSVWAGACPTPGAPPDPGLAGPEPVRHAAARVVTHRTYTYRPDGLLTTIDDAGRGRRRFTLDMVGRITDVAGPAWSERYAYDDVGNLAHATWNATPTGGSDAGNPPDPRGRPGGDPGDDPQGPREYTGGLLRRAGRIRYDYDPQGRVVLRQRPHHSAKPRTWHYTWDAEDRLVGVSTPDGARWTYRYDPLGRRVSKTRHGPDGTVTEVVEFTWDGTNLAEQVRHRPADGCGPHVTTWGYLPATHRPVTQRDRHWLSYAPQSDIDERFHTIVCDLTGAPSELLTPEGDLAWQVSTTIWGTTTSGSTDAASAATHPGAPVDCPLRLPGQYHDPETGHYYNNQRFYDPATARYLSADPLGLAPSPNPYRYVTNPIAEIDPLGLSPCHPYEIGRQVDYDSSDELVQRVRQERLDLAEREGKVTPGKAGNWGAARLENGEIIPARSDAAGHAEEYLIAEANRRGLRITDLYSERAPCAYTCQPAIADYTAINGSVNVTWTWPWNGAPGAETTAIRAETTKAFKEAMKNLFPKRGR